MLKQALNYTANGGAIHLFGGFRHEDVLELPGGRSISLFTEIRVLRKKLPVNIGHKQITLAGSRGARVQHYQEAIKLVDTRAVDLGKLVTHVISLDALPEVIEKLTQGVELAGQICMRAVVDMALKGKVILPYSRYAYLKLQQAAGRAKREIPRENHYREIGFEAELSRLGWVIPSAWEEVEPILTEILQSRVLRDKSNFIFCSTGNSIFAVQALVDVLGQESGNRVFAIDSLDPAALQVALCSTEDLSKTACIGISKSGETLEPRVIMRTLRERFDQAGLDYREQRDQ